MLLNFPKVATEILNTDDDHVLQYPWYFDILRDTQPAPALLKCCEPSLLLILEVSLAASDWSSISFVQKLSSSCYVGLWTWRLWPHRHPLISKDRKRFQFWRTNCISRRTRYEHTHLVHVITKCMYDSARKKKFSHGAKCATSSPHASNNFFRENWHHLSKTRRVYWNSHGDLHGPRSLTFRRKSFLLLLSDGTF